MTAHEERCSAAVVLVVWRLVWAQQHERLMARPACLEREIRAQLVMEAYDAALALALELDPHVCDRPTDPRQVLPV